MHPPIGGEVSTDFKSSTRIKISRLVQILLHFYWFGAPPGGGDGCIGYLGSWGWYGDLLDDVGMMWGWRRWRRQRGDDGDNMGWRPWRPQPWGPHGDLLGAMGMMWGWWGWHRDDVGMTWGRCGDDVGTTGTTGSTWGGDHGDHSHGDHMGTTWGLWGWHGDDGDDMDDVGTTGTTWGQQGHEITKNAITFERTKIIEFHLKIWDPWTLLHTCRLQLMCRWGVFLSQMTFLCKKAPVTLEKKKSCFCTGSH